jgi:hypothetical protein
MLHLMKTVCKMLCKAIYIDKVDYLMISTSQHTT